MIGGDVLRASRAGRRQRIAKNGQPGRIDVRGRFGERSPRRDAVRTPKFQAPSKPRESEEFVLDVESATTPRLLREVGPRARLRATLFALLAFDAATGWASTGQTNEIAVQMVFDAPSAPGDSFSLSIPVPAGHLAAVLFLDAPQDPTQPASAAPSVQELASGLLFPVPVAPGASSAVLSGVVPSTVDAQQLLATTVFMRVLYVDATTWNLWWSEPIALGADVEAPPTPADESATMKAANSTASPTGSMQAQSTTTTQLAMSATQGTASASSAVPLPSVQSGTPTGGKNSNKSNGPISVVMRQTGSAFTYDGSHDQPVPVQGSGH